MYIFSYTQTQLKKALKAILCSGKIISITKVQTTTKVPPIHNPITNREARRICQVGEKAKDKSTLKNIRRAHRKVN